jgi:hypothetical protein
MIEEWKNKSKDYKAFVFQKKNRFEILGIFGSLEFATYNEAQEFLKMHGYFPVIHR